MIKNPMVYRQVHLDFHTSEEIKDVGKNFTKENFQKALQLGHVNSITLFAKCHHGWMYYPSEVSPMHPHLSFDLLSAQINAAEEIGVKTRVYISAGLDERLAKLHPEWLIRNEKDSTRWATDNVGAGYHLFCYNTEYFNILLAQIKEAALKFSPDKIFLDISAVEPCYCAACRAELKQRGKSVLDKQAVLDLANEVYLRYTKAVRDLLDSINPEIGVFHNGGHIVRGRRDIAFQNSYFEVESLPTSKQWGYDHFPLSAAYVRGLGYDYVAMTGKFHSHWGEFGGYKHPNALKYETGVIMSNGGKCGIGDQLHPSGEMDMATYQLIGEAYKEVEQVESHCDYTSFVADIGVLSCEAFAKADNRDIESENIDSGVSRILMEGKFLYDVLDGFSDFSGYKLLILPDIIKIDKELEQKLKEFLKSGGKLLATGLSGLYEDKDSFAFDFGTEFVAESEYCPVYIKPDFDLKSLLAADFVIYSPSYVVKGKNPVANMRNPYFNRTADHFCSHQHAPAQQIDIGAGINIGKDGAYIAYQAFTEYCAQGSLPTKEIVTETINRLLDGNKTVSSNLPAQGLITLSKNEDKKEYALHIVYGAPINRGKVAVTEIESGAKINRGRVEVIEDIIPLHDIELGIKLPDNIKKIYDPKTGAEIIYSIKDGRAMVKLDKIECHRMIVLEY